MDSFLAALTALGPFGVLIIAALDSAGIPIPAGVDALLIAVAAVEPGKAYFAAILAVIGSVAGNIFLFHLAHHGGRAYLAVRTESVRARKFRRWFQQYGLITVFIPTFVPIVPLPLKVFVISAARCHVSYRSFVLTIIAGRVPRFLAMAYLGSQLGNNSMSWLKEHAFHLGVIAVLLFMSMYALVKFVAHQKHIGEHGQEGTAPPPT